MLPSFQKQQWVLTPRLCHQESAPTHDESKKTCRELKALHRIYVVSMMIFFGLDEEEHPMNCWRPRRERLWQCWLDRSPAWTSLPYLEIARSCKNDNFRFQRQIFIFAKDGCRWYLTSNGKHELTPRPGKHELRRAPWQPELGSTGQCDLGGDCGLGGEWCADGQLYKLAATTRLSPFAGQNT